LCTDLLSKCNADTARKRIDSPQAVTHLQGMEELFRIAQTYLCRGIIYGEQKKYTDALADFNKALAISPEFSTALTNRGILFLRQQKFPEAVKDLQAAIGFNPLSWDAHRALAMLHQKTNNRTAYDEDMKEMHKLASVLKAKPYRNTNADYSRLALSYDNKLITAHPNEPAYYAFRASAEQSLAEYKAAIADGTKSIAIKPTSNAYATMAEANFNLEKYAETKKDIEQAIKIGPADARYYDVLARADWQLGNKPEALADRNKQIALAPTDAIAQINAGNTNYAVGKYGAAIVDYSAALRLKGPYHKPTLLGYRGFAYANLKRYTEALADANLALKMDPNCCSGYLVRGMCYNHLGKLKEAQQSLDKAASLAPNEAQGMREEADVAAKTGDFEQATDYMQLAHQLDYRMLMGSKVPDIKMSEYLQTIREYGKLLQSDAKNKDALFNRGILYLCINEPRRAAADFSQFLSRSSWQGSASTQAAMLLNIAYRQFGQDKSAARILDECKAHVPEKQRSIELKYLLGSISENDALRAATDRSSNTMIRSFVALDEECKGMKERALTQYTWIAHNGDESMDGFSLALAGFTRLKTGLKHVNPAQFD
jgi:tetratricopeptide (TPR) repeat protein